MFRDERVGWRVTLCAGLVYIVYSWRVSFRTPRHETCRHGGRLGSVGLANSVG